eukprot:TRINITY_DN8824_c0_g1_i5.p1 TRINITY_DN8824_c0_g1~~TRINITY_DN8824_c0_g1_i5.p1  ORF type:complete len:242 (-),score=34.16 TRINITY_DN8824_c0_g1_i5:210-935(-)
MSGCFPGEDNDNSSTSFVCNDDNLIPTQDIRLGPVPALNIYTDPSCDPSSFYSSSYIVGCQTPKAAGMETTSPYVYVTCNDEAVLVGECSDSVCSDCNLRLATQYDFFGSSRDNTLLLETCLQGVFITCPNLNPGVVSTSSTTASGTSKVSTTSSGSGSPALTTGELGTTSTTASPSVTGVTRTTSIITKTTALSLLTTSQTTANRAKTTTTTTGADSAGSHNSLVVAFLFVFGLLFFVAF